MTGTVEIDHVHTGATDPVRVLGLTKRYGGVTALDGIDLAVQRGSVHGLLGRNGAGKTTLMRVLLGLVRLDSGAVAILGRPTAGTGALPGVAGFVETPSFYPYLSGLKNLDLLAALDGPLAAERVDAVLAEVGLTDVAGRKVRHYSAGMRQRLGLAAVLLRDPELLILDEPATGLDPVGIADLHDLIRTLAATGRTVLLSSHDMAEVERLCDSVTIVSRGRILYSGRLDDLRAQAPAPAFRLTTSDDEAAARHLGGRAEESDAGLLVRAHTDQMDATVFGLAGAGIAVRSLVRLDTALESLFLRLTAEDGDR